MTTESKTHKEVKAFYAEYARTSSSCCGPENSLYPAPLLQGLPSDITNFTAGSGNPITTANLKPGETVLDLGSGGGLDCFLAAREVTESGHVIGVDMTPQMLNRARMATKRLGLKNVEFREGLLEALPIDDNSVDVVISNCVINLSPDKPQVLREIFRVLKPGGRISISDIVTNKPVPEEKLKASEEWCGCTSGALPVQEYTEELRQAGFVDIILQPDLAVARQAIEQGQYKSTPGVTKEEVLKNLDNWETSDHNFFMPHLITARKPG
ncbi:MAG: arsenite methyltransferase [Anaerolineaceae bacterium]|nr:arsenite methyltransferase [Anaerolineaceae bacterium]